MSEQTSKQVLIDIPEEMDSNTHCLDTINHCKQLYERSLKNGEIPSAPVHLKALGALCSFAEQANIDCRWIYDAFASELKSQYQTSMQRFYLGAFAEAMKLSGASFNQTKIAITEWIGLSPRNIDECHAHFERYNAFDLASPQMILKNQVFELASAVINNINLPFPAGRTSQFFKKLQQTIREQGFEKATLPFEYDFAEKKRPR